MHRSPPLCSLQGYLLGLCLRRHNSYTFPKLTDVHLAPREDNIRLVSWQWIPIFLFALGNSSCWRLDDLVWKTDCKCCLSRYYESIQVYVFSNDITCIPSACRIRPANMGGSSTAKGLSGSIYSNNSAMQYPHPPIRSLSQHSLIHGNGNELFKELDSILDTFCITLCSKT